jgi:hypothetical protein
VLISPATAAGIADGSVTLAFRRWDRPRMRAGSTQRTTAGVIRIDSLDGPDPRLALRERAELSDDERVALDERLDRWDAARADGPWTRKILRLIAAHPGVRAPDLAASLGRETLAFKRDVRKLKELGLTVSRSVGYEISPRGRAYLG